MTDVPAPMISREELMGGLSARRGATVLFTIQSRVVHLALRSRQAAEDGLEQQTAESQERTFLAAVAAGRKQAAAPRIQDLERFAPDVAPLIPPDAAVRGDIANRLSEQYAFRAEDVPRLRAALGLDGDDVAKAFERRFRRSIETIYATELGRRERWRWAWAGFARRVDELPPFWKAFAVTLTKTVGAGILALPIALARVGPLGGLVVLVVLGLINVLTIAGLAEAFTRSGKVRYSGAFFGGLVQQYLGRPGAVVLTVAFLLHSSIVLLAYVVGLASTLDDAAVLDGVFWAVVVLAAVLMLLRSRSSGPTVASSLAVGALNIALVLVIALLALAHLDAANVTAIDIPTLVGPSRDEDFDPAFIELVFGVVLAAYYGHTAVGSCAALVLRADPGGRSLMHGTVAATATSIVLYSIWVFSIGGALDADRLAAEKTTTLRPLADVAGPAVLVLGTVFAVTAMGMASIHLALGLTRQTREWLPAIARRFDFVAFVPVLGVFALAIVQLAGNAGSFSGALALVGVTTPPLLAGVFPILLVAAGRRRGELIPAVGVPLLGNVVVAMVLWVFFVSIVVVHGLVIFDDPLSRVLSIAIVILAAVITMMTVRSRLLKARVTIEVRADDELGLTFLNVIAAGRITPASITLRRRGGDVEWNEAADAALPDRVSSLTVAMDHAPPGGLEPWAHRVGLDGRSRSLAISASVHRGAAAPAPLALDHERVAVPLDDEPWTLEIGLDVRARQI